MVSGLNKLCIILLLIPCLLSGVEGKPFILFTVPKSGSHLAIKFLKAMSHATDQMVDENSKNIHAFYKKKFANGTFEFMHYRNQFDARLYKVLFQDIVPIVTLRDPRDNCVSSVFYYKSILNRLLGSNSTFDERLSFTIQFVGFDFYFGPLYFYRRALNLIDHTDPLILRFEDLTGPEGGGSLEAQLETVYTTANRLNIPMTEERAHDIANSLFGSSPTFRKGEIGSWKEHFTELHKEQFKASGLEEILIRLGYENNHDW